MFSPNIDLNIHRFQGFNVSPADTINTMTINIPQSMLRINPNIQSFQVKYVISHPINIINIVPINDLRVSINNSIVPTLPSPPISNFKTSILNTQAQLHSYSKAECVSGCNGAVQFNNQLQCGIPNAMTGLMARKPKMAECVINLEQSKKECLNVCDKINH
jgi:hypothetical protein